MRTLWLTVTSLAFMVIGLKLDGIINISWTMALAPLWIPGLVFVVLFLFFLTGAIFFSREGR